jgi:hypothetical protein
MWLALCGVPADRRSAQRWFAVEPSAWDGASHAQIANVIARRLPRAVGTWSRRRLEHPIHLADAAVALLDSGWPVLVTAICELRKPVLRCRHAFVITGVVGDRVALLDPLGKVPIDGSLGNSWAELSSPSRGRLFQVKGACWNLDLSRTVHVYEPMESNRRHGVPRLAGGAFTVASVEARPDDRYLGGVAHLG